jgi:hypothetical protein
MRERQREAPRTHGMSDLPEYAIYHGIRNRCENPKDVANYAKYGARGIQCLWRTFEEFYAAMGPRPSKHHSIDRLDNSGPYSTENCRWATPRQQGLNKRNNRYLTLHGVTKTLAEWCEQTGLSHFCILYRKKKGWSDARALTTPSRYHTPMEKTKPCCPRRPARHEEQQ